MKRYRSSQEAEMSPTFLILLVDDELNFFIGDVFHGDQLRTKVFRAVSRNVNIFSFWLGSFEVASDKIVDSID